MRALFLAALAVLAWPAAAADKPAAKRNPQLTVAYFSDLQEQPPFTPAEMADRDAAGAADDPEGVAADRALNDWKLCIADAITRWADLKPGPGALIDGAYGRCAEIERGYRGHLMKIQQDGRAVVDVQMARTMTRSLEDIWRPRLVAAVLDAELARTTVAAPKPAGPK